MKKYLFITGLLLSINCFAFDTWWHAECTRKAMVANGFSADARLATQVSNYLTDFMSVLDMGNDKLNEFKINSLRVKSDKSYAYLHFDAIFTEQDIETNWEKLLNNTIGLLRKYSGGASIEPGFRLIIYYNIIGASLHTVQDFYSHSNWVNLYMKTGTAPIPIWYEVAKSERAKMKVLTGIYEKPFNGHISHDELNKDNSSIQYNKEAVEAAERASIDWVKRLIDSVPGVPWSELKSYNIQSDIVMKKFLVTQDASFVTSSSISGFHFDGKNPVKKVFANNVADDHTLASTVVLPKILVEYTNNMGNEKNKYRLPTPYWAGFMGYYISKELAVGLKLNETVYK